MISFNFLGLGSFSATQQKGKTNGTNSTDPENGSVLLEGETQASDAAFPNVLMQLLLGQQLPIAVQVKTDQQLIPSEAGTDREILTSDKPMFTGAQTMPLQEQLLAGEMKKQTAIQKATAQLSNSVDLKISPNKSGYIELSELPLEALEVTPGGSELQKQTANSKSLQPVFEPKINLDGINIPPAQIQPNSNQQDPSVLQGKNKNIITDEVKPTGNIEAKPQTEVLEMNIPKLTKETNSETVIKETEPSKLSQNKLSPKVENELINDITQRSGNNPTIVPSNKQVTLNKELELTPITSNDIHQKGILSAVVTQSGKAVKIKSESTVIDKSNSSEKQTSSASPVEIDKSETIVKNEMQNSGNGSFAPRENLDRHPSSEKSIASVDGRQGQQLFTTAVEEKNNIIASKTNQTDIASLLRNQDTVNNIVEQLAKNVTVSIHENNSQMKILLKPEALGDVMLKVTVEQGKVSTQMEVQQPQVKAVIEANIQVLRDSLSSKGLVVDRIDISTSQYSLNEKSSHQGQQRSNTKNYFGKEIAEEIVEQTKLFGYNTVDYVA